MKHLSEPIRALAMEEPEKRIVSIKSGCWIGYERAQKAVERIESLLTHPKRSRMPNLLIIGATNNGKTMITERVMKLHPRTFSEDGEKEIIPILRVQMPPAPSSSIFYTELLKAIEFPVKTIGKLENRMLTVYNLLKRINVRILIIDELHNMLSANASRQREMLGLLRFIGNELCMPMVCLGTQEARDAIRSDPQLENRFEPIFLPFWKNDLAFCNLLASYEISLPLRKVSNLTEDHLRNEIFIKSDGMIGEISAILEKAAIIAIRTGEERITLDIVKKTGHQSPTERRRSFESVML